MTRYTKALAALLIVVVTLGGAAYVAWPSGDAASEPPPALSVLQAGTASAPYGVFEGRVPCSGACERIKVRLTLHRNPESNAPAEYMLERIYVGLGNDRTTTRGTWSTLDAPKVYDGPVIRLDGASPSEFATYLPVGDVLLFLDDGLKPRVGDASHSFTLSRTR